MTYVPTVMYVNDYDTSRLGLVVSRWEGADVGDRTDIKAEVFRRAGSVLLDGRPRVSARKLTVEATMLHDTVALRQVAMKNLAERLNRGTVEIRFIDEPDLVYLARLQQLTPDPPNAGQTVEPLLRVRVELECANPYRYEVGSQLVAVTMTPVRLPLGTAPSPLIVRVYGATTNPTLTLRHANGTALGTLGLSIVLDTDDWIEINSDLGTLTKSVGGEESEAYDALLSGDFLVADPLDGDSTLDGGPTLELSAGTGDARWKRWLTMCRAIRAMRGGSRAVCCSTGGRRMAR